MSKTTYAARISPSTAFILRVPRRLPLPRPLEGDRRAAAGCVGANKVDVGCLVKVGVRMELPGDEVLEFPRCGGVCICEAVDLGVLGADGAHTTGCCCHNLLRLPDNEGEGEGELVIVIEFEDKRWARR